MNANLAKLETPKTMTDAVYHRLRNDIIQGTLIPGSKLKIEHLRSEYDVGATPVREALSRLTSSGFVKTEGQRGFRVAPISADDLADITEMRITLELKALRKSILTGGDDWESNVVASYYQLSKLETVDISKNLAQWDKRNQVFHSSLISACSSKWLMHFHNILYDQHRRYRNISLSDRGAKRDVHSEHERIYEAALSRDADTACKETEKHIRLTAERTIQILEKNGSDE
jgi:DNA-binding GntR family transcriptional regulator